MKGYTLFGILAGALLLPASLASQDRYFLDLTLPGAILAPPEQRTRCGPRLSGGGHGVAHIELPDISLALEIFRLSAGTYKLGQQITYELRLTNVGRVAISIPWSTDEGLAGDNCYHPEQGFAGRRSLTGTFALEFTNSEGIAAGVGPHALYAAQGNPDTYRVLEPRESARIKLNGVVDLSKPRLRPEYKFELLSDFSVTAWLLLDNSMLGNPFKDLTSINPIKVRVEKP